MAIVLHEQSETACASAAAANGDLWLSRPDLERATGWSLKPEGFCKGSLCVPVPPARAAAFVDGERANASAFWRHMGAPVVSADTGDVWVFGTPSADRGEALRSLEAPDFTLPALDGTSVMLSKIKGQVALINIWATWCPPCRAEMPTIQATYEQYRDQGFTVLAVDVQEDPRTIAAFMREYKLTFPALLDLDGTVSQTYQAYALPSSFFVDRKGIIRAVYRGPMPRGVIAGTVEQLLQEGA